MAINLDTILKLSTQKKLMLLGLVIAVISALFLWWIILPEYKNLEKKDHEYNKLKVDLDAKKKVAQDLATFQAKLEKVQRELGVMKAQLPDKKEIPKLLKTVSSLGKESGLQFQLFRPIREISKEFYAEIPVEVQVVGSYHEVGAFFYKVGMLDRIVNITNVNMGKPTEEKGEMKLTTSCLATTFKFVEAPAPTKEPEAKKSKKKKRRKKK